jgi:hypothetical protein
MLGGFALKLSSTYARGLRLSTHARGLRLSTYRIHQNSYKALGRTSQDTDIYSENMESLSYQAGLVGSLAITLRDDLPSYTIGRLSASSIESVHVHAATGSWREHL